MAATQARMTARARARAAQQKVLADRKRRDEANIVTLTTFFAAAEQIDAARLTMARALDEIRAREGTLSAAATLTGIPLGEARKLVALLSADPDTSFRNHDSDAAAYVN
ncbi:hypothetical protein [Rhodococcoides corynebacterioides]|uniref:Uncharacterized protein n=1 Tax=Rhodococcoides corynebacterioides TaxID=53972 RepID=A0ABS7P3G9_9NOCA|nr:hypothetical protein [Rhodococcus corynebacterioides]MBY6366928.1 hypothetical protein [Rhodococcus corynebacterioides]MBY6407730.1 hypothetical protein [Rhodococcus corynebacterioides]